MPYAVRRVTSVKIVCLAGLLLAASLGWSSEKIKGIKLEVSNPTEVARPAANVVVSINDLRKIAPDITPGSLIVTATDATTVEDDAAVLATIELPLASR